jgi:hypothetical protein
MTELVCSNEYTMSINFSCFPDTKENAHIVNWNELNPVSYPDSLGVVENDSPEFVGYSHYQPEPYIIRNGSNFHATLSHEGLFSGKVQCRNLDQNLITEDLPLKQGQIFVLKDTWLGKIEINKCIFIESTIRDLYGRKVVDITFLRISDWIGHIDKNGNEIEPIKNMTIKELYNGHFIHKQCVVQAGKIIPPFRNDTDVLITPTEEFYNFGDRNLFADMEKYDLKVKKTMDKELVEKQQSPMEMFF